MRFESYHPAINLIYFATAILCTVCFNHPAFLILSYVSSFAYSVKLGGKRALVFDICLIPLIGIYTFIYSYYNHFGITNIGETFIGNDITLESVIFGLVIGTTGAAVVMFCSCMLRIFSADKVTYLFGRISPKLSLFISILIRGVPKIKERAAYINTARRGIGRGSDQGGAIARMKNSVGIFSIMVTWTLESFVESGASMKSRGYSLKGRTAFSIYRFDNRDRTVIISMFVCMTLILMAVLLDQTDIMYDPEIIMNRVTYISYIFYGAYGVFLLTPTALHVAGDMKFKRLRKKPVVIYEERIGGVES